MAVCYIDINHFKPYNDVYGFSHGDEVLRMLARVMFNAVKESGGGFAGHIGGDDFVFIVPMERSEAVCKTIIINFKAIAADLFEEREKLNGYYIGTNRKGQEEHFPLLSIAIAVVPTITPIFNHYGKVAETAAELKKLAKKSNESCFVIDQRIK
jgi:GGDEF domain-containing protein